MAFELELQCEQFPLTKKQVASLLDTACDVVGESDNGQVSIRCVSNKEMQNLNKTYRKKDAPTNILTFSYDENEHDIAICMNVAEKEAKERKVELVDYTALLVTHAFLHALGMDHEESEDEEKKTEELEKKILSNSGFATNTLFAL
ncbi:MAG: rRNA maturation RNase YbeY [Candidatus Andersenbacteria bacterium]